MSIITNCSREFIVKSTSKKTRNANKNVCKQRQGVRTIQRERKIARDEPYEIFEKLKKHAEEKADPIWEEVFDQASKDFFPKNIKYTNEILSFRYKNMNHELILDPDEDIEKLYSDVKVFIQQNIGIYSAQDISNIQNSIDEYYSSLQKKEPRWSDLTKSEKIKVETMIKKYAEETCEKDNKEQQESLINAIKMKMYCGKNSEGTFTIENDKLTSVGGIIFDEEKKLYRLADCKITKIINTNSSFSDDESCSTAVPDTSKKIKKSNFLKYIEKLSMISGSDSQVKLRMTTDKRQTKRKH